jgi:hypothetical protein
MCAFVDVSGKSCSNNTIAKRLCSAHWKQQRDNKALKTLLSMVEAARQANQYRWEHYTDLCVQYWPQRNRWALVIDHEYLGSFPTKEDALLARDTVLLGKPYRATVLPKKRYSINPYPNTKLVGYNNRWEGNYHSHGVRYYQTFDTPEEAALWAYQGLLAAGVGLMKQAKLLALIEQITERVAA